MSRENKELLASILDGGQEIMRLQQELNERTSAIRDRFYSFMREHELVWNYYPSWEPGHLPASRHYVYQPQLSAEKLVFATSKKKFEIPFEYVENPDAWEAEFDKPYNLNHDTFAELLTEIGVNPNDYRRICSKHPDGPEYEGYDFLMARIFSPSDTYEPERSYYIIDMVSRKIYPDHSPFRASCEAIVAGRIPALNETVNA